MKQFQTPLEEVLVTSYKDQMISFMQDHPGYFEEAIQLAIGDKQPYSWRSAWLLWSCMEDNDMRIRKYINKMLEVVETKADGHMRELLKILLKMELNEDQEGRLFNICVSVWEAINKRPSVRFSAFTGILGIAQKYPELKDEIRLLTQRHYIEHLSPGIKNSVSRSVREFFK